VLLVTCACSVVAAAVLHGATSTPPMAWVGAALIGFALGPQFATMFAVADAMIGLDGRTTSRIIAAAGLGSLLAPSATGWLLDRFGTSLLPTIVLVGAVASTIAALVVRRFGASLLGPHGPPDGSIAGPPVDGRVAA
jgi:fucose permease